jgi:hypothetical protein
MYNEEASTDHNGNWFCFVSMDKNIGFSTSLGQNGDGGYQSYQNLKSMEEKGLIIRKKKSR